MSAPGERRAWVRGAGAVTALGADWPTSVRALAAGHSAVAPVTRFDVTGFPSQVAAAIADHEAVAAHVERTRHPVHRRRQRARLDTKARMVELLAAARRARQRQHGGEGRPPRLGAHEDTEPPGRRARRRPGR